MRLGPWRFLDPPEPAFIDWNPRGIEVGYGIEWEWSEEPIGRRLGIWTVA